MTRGPFKIERGRRTRGFGLRAVVALSSALVAVWVLVDFLFGESLRESWFAVFINEWGDLLGLAIGLLVAFLLAMIPSRLESRVDEIADRLNMPIKDFEELVHHALDTLNAVSDRPNSRFLLISASPMLGIELAHDDPRMVKWKALLDARVNGKLHTRVVCLNLRRSKSPRSDLGEFAHALAEVYLGQPERANEIFRSAKTQLLDFARLCERVKGSEVSFGVGGDPPFQIILGIDESTSYAKGIVYHATSASLRDKVGVWGFVTQDFRTTTLLEQVFRHIEKSTTKLDSDPRDAFQTKRDEEIEMHYQSHPNPYEFIATELEGKPNLVINSPAVFPSDISLARQPIALAIDHAFKTLLPNINDLVGIDVGTGCGLHAFHLARYCREVYACDVKRAAIVNAQENQGRLRSTHPNVANIRFYEGSFEQLFLPDPARALADKWPVIVFNHPLYPTTGAVSDGKYKYGSDILHSFLKFAIPAIGERGFVILAAARIASGHNPMDICHSNGLELVDEPFEYDHPDYSWVKACIFRKRTAKISPRTRSTSVPASTIVSSHTFAEQGEMPPILVVQRDPAFLHAPRHSDPNADFKAGSL